MLLTPAKPGCLCSINSFVLISVTLQCQQAHTIKDGDFSHETDYGMLHNAHVNDMKFLRTSKLHHWLNRYCNLAEYVDFAYSID